MSLAGSVMKFFGAEIAVNIKGELSFKIALADPVTSSKISG